MMIWRVAIVAIVCAGAVSPAAMAAHGKVGTWEVTIQTSGSGMGAMSDMSKLPPAVQARMKAHGVHMGAGGAITTKFCMTAEQVNKDQPDLAHHGACETQNMKMKANAFSADIVCKGKMNARGHIEAVFDSAEHYKGRTTMAMTINGQPTTQETTMEARWLSPECTVPRKH